MIIRPRVILALLLDPFFYRRALAALLISGALTVVVMGVLDTRQTTAVMRGDFPAFWSLAVIASGDNPTRLYDTELQREIQNQAWPSLNGEVLPAAYPPYLAYILQPVSSLDHTTARWAWTVLSLLLMYISVVILVSLNRRITWKPWMVLVPLMMFSPILRGVIGGQFLPISLFLLAACLLLIRRGGVVADLVLGITIGTWLCKPYYALCALLTPMFSRRWLTLVAFTGVALLWWGVGAEVLGAEWFSKWSSYAAWFGGMNLETNAHQMPNLWAQVYRLYREVLGLKPEQITGVNTPWFSYCLAYCAFIALFYFILGSKALKALLFNPRRYSDLILAISLTAVIIFVPQVNFYDLGVPASIVLYLFRPDCKNDWAFCGISVAMSQLAVDPPFGVPIHFILAIGALFYVTRRVRGEVLISYSA
jgi:hypothetical protein